MTMTQTMPSEYYINPRRRASRTTTPLSLQAEHGWLKEPGGVPGELTKADLDRGYGVRRPSRRFARNAKRRRAVIMAPTTMGSKAIGTGLSTGQVQDQVTGETRKATATRPSDRRARNRARNKAKR
jgi:hypothetical protein